MDSGLLEAADRALGLDRPWILRARLDSPRIQGRRFRGRLLVLRAPGPEGPRVVVQLQPLASDGNASADDAAPPTDPILAALDRDEEIVFGASPARAGQLDVAFWIPESRRLRRVNGVQGTDLFADTLFAWEDLAWAGSPERHRIASTRRESGRHGEVRVATSAPYHHFSRVETWIDPASGLPSRVRYFGPEGAAFRELRFEAVRTVSGRAFPMRWVAEDLLSGARGRLDFDVIRFEIDPAQRAWLSADGLQRRLRRGALPFPRDLLAWPQSADEPAP